MQRLVSLVAVLGALSVISACGGGSAGGGDGGDLLQQVKDAVVLRVSTDPAYPPQSFHTESGV